MCKPRKGMSIASSSKYVYQTLPMVDLIAGVYYEHAKPGEGSWASDLD